MIGAQEGMIPLRGLGAVAPFEPLQVSLSILLLAVGILVALLLPLFIAAWAHLIKGGTPALEGQGGQREESLTSLSPPQIPLSTLSDEELDALITFMRWRGSHHDDPTPPTLKRGEVLQRRVYPSLGDANGQL